MNTYILLLCISLFSFCYASVVVPNGKKAEFEVIDGVKVFHLIAKPIEWEIAKGLTIRAWGYNDTVPGPLIEAVVGDQVRIYVTNQLPAPTTVHWHGVILPCGMDGTSGLTQPDIQPGETFVYKFTFQHSGTFMYHSHYDGMTQDAMGLVGMIVVHENSLIQRPDRDFAILLQEWDIPVGTSRPNTYEMSDFNILTMNGKAMPDTDPLVAKLGDRVWMRYGNLSAMSHHSIHLHGYSFNVIGSDGGWAKDPSSLLPETTVFVPVGSAKVIELMATNPGDWMLHCHMTHHTMNQMGHNAPNVLGMDASDFDQRIQKLIPGYMMTMGTTNMVEMSSMHMPVPENSIPMVGLKGQFAQTEMGGMATVFKVREGITNYEDPGPYNFPKGSVASKATEEELQRDKITP